MDKTPITLLNEYCTKHKLALKFTLLPSSQKKEFVYQANAESAFSIASGVSKKIAKHNSAEKLLQLLNPQYSYSNNKNLQLPAGIMPEKYIKHEINDKNPFKAGNDLEIPKNSIVELHELSQQMRWPLPLYEFSSINSPTEPFTCTVRLDSHIKTGKGKSKKLAKLNASSILLYSLKNYNYLNEFSSTSNGNNIDVKTNSDYLKAVEDASILLKKQTLMVLKPSDSQKIAQFYKMLKGKPEKTLASLQNIFLNQPSTNYIQMLEEIAEEQNFSITYTDLNESTIDGQSQCMVQLGSFPVAVVHGSGETKDHARYQAAHNALQYLKIMTRKI